jgi:hypothetical protein
MKMTRAFRALAILSAFLGFSGCATPPFDPKSDIRITSISSLDGRDEINPNTTRITAQSFPYDQAIIQFQLNNGVGVTLQEIEINYSQAEGSEIVFQDANGAIQTGIPSKKTRVQRRFPSTIPFTELGQSGAVIQDPANAPSSTGITCCLILQLVTNQARDVLSIDGDFNTEPNLGTDIITSVTVRGIDDNDNPFSREAAIGITAIPEAIGTSIADTVCSECTIGATAATEGAGAAAGAAAGGAAAQ